MKKKVIYLIMSLLFLSQSVLAQMATDTIKIDFLNPKQDFKQMKYDDSYIIEISNLNLGLYKVENVIESKEYNIEVPSAFGSITLPAHFIIPAKEKAKEANGAFLPAKSNNELANLSYGNVVKEIVKNLIVVDVVITKMDSAVQLNNTIKNLYESCGLSYSQISKSLVAAVNRFVDIPSNDANVQALGIRTTLESAINNSFEANRNLQKLKYMFNRQLETEKEINQVAIDEWEEKKTQTKNKDYSTWKAAFEKATEKNKALDATKDSLNSAIDLAAEVGLKLKEFKDENKIYELVKSYKLINKNTFTYYSDPIDADGDEIKVKLSIVSESPLACDRSLRTQISHKYRVVEGCKLDFSTGVFFNFGSKSFLNGTLKYEKVTDSTSMIVERDDKLLSMLSVGALVHLHKRTSKNFALGASGGVSTTAGFDALNFHLGFSGIMGYKERLILTIGATMKESSILDSEFKLNEVYSASDLPEDVPMTKAFPSFGFFVALTYNFSKFKSE